MIGKTKPIRCIVCGVKWPSHQTVNGLFMCTHCNTAFKLGVKYALSKEYKEGDIPAKVDEMSRQLNDLKGRYADLSCQLGILKRRM